MDRAWSFSQEERLVIERSNPKTISRCDAQRCQGDCVTEAIEVEDLLIGLAVESWRLCRLFQRSIDTRDIKAAGRQSNQVRYFQRKLEDSLTPLGLRLVELEGQPWDSGMAATALNAEDFGPEDALFVDQMMEPIVMGPDGVRRTGTMMLRK